MQNNCGQTALDKNKQKSYKSSIYRYGAIWTIHMIKKITLYKML